MHLILVGGPFPIPSGPHSHSQSPPLSETLQEGKQGYGLQLLTHALMDRGDSTVR